MESKHCTMSNACMYKLCCVALPFCCVVVVALPFSASLEGLFMYIHVDTMYMSTVLYTVYKFMVGVKEKESELYINIFVKHYSFYLTSLFLHLCISLSPFLPLSLPPSSSPSLPPPPYLSLPPSIPPSLPPSLPSNPLS